MSRKNRQRESTPSPVASTTQARAQISPRTLGTLWLLLLALGILIAAFQASRQTSLVEEFPQACDSFGYQQMAQDIRLHSAPHNLQPFTASSPKALALIAELRRQNIPLAEWEAMIGPQAYHVKLQPQKTADAEIKIVNQYPPGVPRLLALFPQGNALSTLYLLSCSTLTLLGIAGLAALLSSWWKKQNFLLLAAASIWAVATNLALMLLGTTVSYSVDFSTVPLLAIPLLFLAINQNTTRLSWPLLAIAAALAGYAIQMRITSIFFLPGWLALCVLTATNLSTRISRSALFSAIAFLVGPLPLMLHQHALTGSYFTSTYGSRDTTPASLDYLSTHLPYYFTGDGSLGNWALWMALIALAAAFLFTKTSHLPAAQKTLRNFTLAAALTFLIPTLYFVTHKVTTPYYALPTLLATIATIATTLWAAAKSSQSPSTHPPLHTPAKIALALFLLPGISHLVTACTPSTLTRTADFAEHNMTLPPPLQDPSTWILADRFTGTLWFYHGLHAQSFLEASPRARALLYRFAHSRGEKQFVILDLPPKEEPLKSALQEILLLGGTFKPVGTLDNRPVAEILWPPTGPTTKP